MKPLNNMPENYQHYVAEKMTEARENVKNGQVLTLAESREQSMRLLQKLQEKQLSEQNKDDLIYA